MIFSNSSYGHCVPCKPGFYSIGNFQLCWPCPQGTFTDQYGASECKLCNSNQYCPAGIFINNLYN